VRTAAYEIIKRKGATNHAIGLTTAALLRSALRGERRVLTVSRVQTGALGFRDVALSLSTVVDVGGAMDVIAPTLDETERRGLEHSADVLRAAIESVRQ
jgi:L-lactate dehydrogenase